MTKSASKNKPFQEGDPSAGGSFANRMKPNKMFKPQCP
jgi:hypothetical protein